MLAGLWPAVDAAHEAVRRAAEVAGDLEEAEAVRTELSSRAEACTVRSEAAHERLRTLQGTVGAAVAELQRQLAEVADLLAANESSQLEATGAAENAIAARGKAEGRREELTEQLRVATQERAGAAEVFRRFAGTGLLDVALPDLDVPDPDAPGPPTRRSGWRGR